MSILVIALTSPHPAPTYRYIKDSEESLVVEPYQVDGSGKEPRYYQVEAINRVIEAVAKGKNRLLLVMATGTPAHYRTPAQRCVKPLHQHQDQHPVLHQSAKILTMLPKAAEAYRLQIERGLDNDPREAAKARVILRDLLGPIQMCPSQDGSLWAQYHTRPAALIKRAVGASVELSGSGGSLR